MITELIPEFDSRKSFYKKALVINEDNKLKLQSYNTIFAELKKARIEDIDSIISSMCVAFAVKYVNKDVYDALIEDYINKKEVV